MRITAAYFGTFDPPHHGHLGLAAWVLARTEAAEVRFIVSGRNPFKEAGAVSPFETRLAWTLAAVRGRPGFAVSDVERDRPSPTYTVDTMAILRRAEPDVRFALLLGADQAKDFQKWKDWEALLDGHEVWVYPRPGASAGDGPRHPHWIPLEAPIWPHSSTEIRRRWAAGDDASEWTSISAPFAKGSDFR